MRATEEPPAEPVVERARERVIQTLLVWRARALPLISAVALTMTWLDPRPWRVVLFSVGALILVVLSLVELRAVRQGRPLTPARVRTNLVVSGLFQLGMVAGSGGLASPIAPAVLIVALMFNLSAPRRLAARFLLLVQIPTIWLLAIAHAYDLVPGLVPFASFAAVSVPLWGPMLAAVAYTLFLLAVVTLGQWMRETLDLAVEERVAEQQRRLEMHAEAGRAMSALSAELAHELKNPLASIKGLAGLLRRDVEGTGKERLDVMRGEIDRMQGILEEFLNHSRPLVPLELRATSLEGLVAEVLALHEGMVLGRGVTLTLVEGPGHVVTCDPRKVRQVIVNLVQNAIEASPAGAPVSVRVATEADVVHVDVEDRGAGIAPQLRHTLFEAGATTKPTGSGIGLAIARGLARQHEGDLTLVDREGGGCRARLTLPIAGPRAARASEEASGLVEAPASDRASEGTPASGSSSASSTTARSKQSQEGFA